jgi:cell division protein FtsI/penicillin-binding protein 2
VTAHIIGFTGVDDNGQEALELAFDDVLVGKPGARRVIKDRLGHIVEDIESIQEPQNGKTLTLAIDAKLQYLAHRELKKAVAEHRAKAGGLVVLDSLTGEVLALANVPTYNPNNRGPVRSEAHAQPRRDGSFRARLDIETIHRRSRTRSRHGERGLRNSDRTGTSHNR